MDVEKVSPFAPSEREYHTVILAALLHDIGKLLQRGSFGSLDSKGKHPQVSADFISLYSSLFEQVANPELLKTLVQHHHESPQFPKDLRVDGIPDPYIRSLASVISLADNFSASERGEFTGQWQDFKFTPMAPVIENIQMEKSGRTPAMRFRAHPLVGTDDKIFDGIFPSTFSKYAEGELNKLLEEFGKEFANWVKKLHVSSFDIQLYYLLHLFNKYSWCLPSNTQEDIPDVSLFDHLKMTTAIASCLYIYHKENNSLDEKTIRAAEQRRFCLVAGDLSGIQSYIFSISNIGAGGIARKLRARSFFIQLVIESCAQKILKKFDLSPANIIIAAGGNFYLLVPNISATKFRLENINREIDAWFLKNLNAEIALNLAFAELDGVDFHASSEKYEGFGSILKKVNDRLSISKQNRLSSVLQKDNWQEVAFIRDVDFKGQEACQSCGKFPRNDINGLLCGHCQVDKNTGKDLPNRDILAFYSDSAKGNISLPYGSASLVKNISQAEDIPEIAIKLNSPDLSDLVGCPAQSKFIATYIPVVVDEADKKRLFQIASKSNIKDDALPEIGEPVIFELLAAQARGRKYLGFLKMDADNIGMATVFGLKRDKPDSGMDTVSRLATLSRQVEWFFAGWIQHLISQEFKNCYIVFSGGDDLFIVGPWDEIINLADRINADYAKYTGNPELTLSAGIVIAGSSYPISLAATAAGDAMKESKKEDHDKNIGHGNKLTLLGSTLSWGDWNEVKQKWKELSGKLLSEDIKSSFLYSLLEYGRMWNIFKRGDAMGLKFQPLLAYNVGRNLNEKKNPAFYAWAQSIISLKLDELKQKQTILDNLDLLGQLLILGKEGDDKE